MNKNNATIWKSMLGFAAHKWSNCSYVAQVTKYTIISLYNGYVALQAHWAAKGGEEMNARPEL